MDSNINLMFVNDFSMTVKNLRDFFILTIKNVDYRVYIVDVDKKNSCIFVKELCFK